MTVFGCLLPAPWLGMIAGLLLAFGPAQGLPDRFAPITLAVTHCLVLGMLAPVMIGALFQLMPVAAGQSVAAARRIAPYVAVGSALVATGLCAGFLFGWAPGFMLAAGLASLLYGAVACALAAAAWRVRATDATTRTLRWIVLALAMAVALGVAMAGQFSGWWRIDVLHMLKLHVAWGLLGWIASLLAGVASTTVPMFWQTARPSARWQAGLPGLLWLPLLCALWPGWWRFSLYLGCAVVGTLAATGLYVLGRARRRFDPAWPLWLMCAASWLLAAALVAVDAAFSPVLPHRLAAALPWWIGTLALVGGAVMPVNAMLGKIIPFLVFLHLRRHTPMGQRVVAMQAILPPRRLRWQASLTALSLLLLLLLPLAPAVLAVAAGLAFAVSQACMAILLLHCLLRYRRELSAILFPAAAISPK